MKNVRIQKYMGIAFFFMLSIGIFINIYVKSDIILHARTAEVVRQMVEKDGLKSFFSKEALTYPGWHIVMLSIENVLKIVGPLFGLTEIRITIASAILACTLGVIGTYLAFAYMFVKTLPDQVKDFRFLLAFLLILTGPYYFPFINESYYLGQGLIMPWHNATILGVYPVAIVCHSVYFDLVKSPINKQNKKKWICFTLLLFLSGLFKPVFFAMYIPGMVIFCLYELIASKGKNIKFCINSFFAVIPTCFLAIRQHLAVFGPKLTTTKNHVGDTMVEKGQTAEFAIAGIGIEWLKVQKMYSKHPFLSLLCILVFAIFVVGICFYRKEVNRTMQLSLCIFASGFLQYTFFYEQYKADNGNFAWGYYISLAIMYIECISYFAELCRNKSLRYLKYIGIVLYLGHVLFGSIYCIRLLTPGFSYSGTLF